MGQGVRRESRRGERGALSLSWPRPAYTFQRCSVTETAGFGWSLEGIVPLDAKDLSVQ